ncbi:hypothetical protein KM043_004726 [Ampulex compressa]|nr:hypothetical protein KM043_004726 [Ampulex compressa]
MQLGGTVLLRALEKFDIKRAVLHFFYQYIYKGHTYGSIIFGKEIDFILNDPARRVTLSQQSCPFVLIMGEEANNRKRKIR